MKKCALIFKTARITTNSDTNTICSKSCKKAALLYSFLPIVTKIYFDAAQIKS